MANILIGIGGVGSSIVRRVKHKISSNPATRDSIGTKNFFMGIDIDVAYDATIHALDMVESFEEPNPPAQIEARRDDAAFNAWWRKGFTITTALVGQNAGGQIRTAGRLVFYTQFAKVEAKIDSIIREARALCAGPYDATTPDTRLNVFIVASSGGGTGSGIIVDTTFLVRSHLLGTDFIYGVLLDGSVTRLFDKGGGTELNGFAALTEIEHWMTNAKDFKMQYAGGRLNAETFAKKTFFDICFLVEGSTMDGKGFSGTTDEMAYQYKELAAEYVETLIASSAFGRTSIANVFNHFQNIIMHEGRSFNYASFAISHVSFPVDKVTDYCTAKYITGRLPQRLKAEIPSLDDLETELGIREWDGNMLSMECRKSPSYSSIQTKKQASIDRMKETENPQDFQGGFAGSDLRAFSSWDKMFNAYKSELTQSLQSKKEKVKAKIERVVFDAGASMCFDTIREFLIGFIARAEKSIKHIEKEKKEYATKQGEKRKGLEHDAQVVLESKVRNYLFLKGDFTEKRDVFVEKNFKNWFKSEEDAIEYEPLKNFYDEVKLLTSDLLWTVRFMEESFNGARERFTGEMERYSSHKFLLSPNRQQAGDYVLDMEMSVDRPVVDEKIYSEVIQKLDEINIESMVGAGIGTIAGVLDMLETTYKEYIAVDRKKRTKVEASFNQKKDEYKEKILLMLKTAIRDKVRDVVYGFKIEDAIDWFLEGCKADIARAHDDPQEKAMLQNKLDPIFGQGVESLFKTSMTDSEWKKIAAKMLLQRMLLITNPFVSLNNGMVNVLHEKAAFPYQPGHINIQNMLCHAGFPYRDVGIEVLAKPDLHRITFLQQRNFFPLLACTYLRKYGDTYKKQLEAEQDSSCTRPMHADMRFTTIWKDDILLGKTISEIVQGMSRLCFAMGLGSQLIQRNKRIFNFYNEDGKIIFKGNGLLDALSNLQYNDELRKDFVSVLLKKIEGLWYPNNKLEDIWKVFKDANEELTRFEPSEADKIYHEWCQLVALSKFRDGKPVSAQVPAVASAVKSLLADIEEYTKM